MIQSIIRDVFVWLLLLLLLARHLYR